jgi:cell wall-associated NlpC family hydrolase
MGAQVQQMTRDQVVAEARRWIGTNWRHQGRSARGVDCLGLIVMVANAFGVPVRDRTDYARDPTSSALLVSLRSHLVFVRPDENHVGTVGIFRQVKTPCHVGILTTRNGMLHVVHGRAGVQTVIEEQVEGAVDLHLVEAGAFPGLAD